MYYVCYFFRYMQLGTSLKFEKVAKCICEAIWFLSVVSEGPQDEYGTIRTSLLSFLVVFAIVFPAAYDQAIKVWQSKQ